MRKKKRAPSRAGLKNWVCYLDEETGKPGAIEDDHIGVTEMVENKPGWKLLGFYYGTLTDAIDWTNAYFIKD